MVATDGAINKVKLRFGMVRKAFLCRTCSEDEHS